MPRLPDPEKALRRKLAANVRRLREEQKLTLEDAGERAGMHWRHWQKIEGGEVNATLRTLSRLGTALGVDPAALLVRPVEG